MKNMTENMNENGEMGKMEKVDIDAELEALQNQKSQGMRYISIVAGGKYVGEWTGNVYSQTNYFGNEVYLFEVKQTNEAGQNMLLSFGKTNPICKEILQQIKEGHMAFEIARFGQGRETRYTLLK